MPWIGTKKLALVPVYRPHFNNPPDVIPPNWPDLIMQRMVNDPPAPGDDRSLRAYIRAASSGLADLEAVVQPQQDFDGHAGDVEPTDLDSLLGPTLRAQGFDAAALVMLGGVGAGTAIIGGYWARFVMVEDLGVWAMEFMHCLTGFNDLYPFAGHVGNSDYNGNIGNFDEMAASAGTHPSAYTKAAIGWLTPSAIAQHSLPAAGYDLYSVGHVQPPSGGQATAVRIGSTVPYLMVESREKVDQFDAGIPAEGVIVYRVQTTDPLGSTQNAQPPVYMLTTNAASFSPTALGIGQTYTDPSGVTVKVSGWVPGGYQVIITDPSFVKVPNVFQDGVTAATNTMTAAGLKPVFTGPNQRLSWVRLQEPPGGQIVSRGTTVTMTLSTGIKQ